MIWRYQDFELDDLRFELRRGGVRVAIPPKPLALLLHLAKRHPASVTRRELFNVLWPEVRVTRASVARAVLAARRAVGAKNGDGEGVIRTVRGRGYALGDAFSSEPLAAPSAASPMDAPLVGRAGELASIEACLDRVEIGHGRLLLIAGEPGIGKSRLLDEVGTRALARRALVVSGHCREDDGAPPYWPWPQILRDLMAQCDNPSLHAARDELMAALAPRHGEHTGGGPVVSEADARFRLFHAAIDILRQAARGRMLVVLIEDLQWAGPGALHLLRFVGRSLSNAQVLIAMTYRSSGPPPHELLEATVGELTALSHAVPVMTLGGFAADEISAYVEHATGSVPDAEHVRRLHDAAGGNPLFLRELVPMLGNGNGNGASPDRLPIPSSITHLLRTHVGRLSSPVRDVVELASVVGREVTPQLLARASGRHIEAVLEQLEEARAENLIVRVRSGRYRFRHDIIRHALYDALGPACRIGLHERVARAIEAGDVRDPHLGQLAHHFFAAIPRTGPKKAVEYARRAAEAARDALDFDGAVLHYRQALAALREQHGAPAAVRCDLLLGLGEVLEVTGQLAQSREAILKAAEIARGLRSFVRLGRAALARTAWQLVIVADPIAVALVEEALHAVGRRDLALRARLLTKLAVLRRLEGKEADAGRVLAPALALAKRLRDLPLHCDVLVHQLQVMDYGIPGDRAARLAVTEKLLHAAERAKNAYAILQCRRSRLALFLEASAGRELDEEIEHFARESAVARCKQHYAAVFRAMRCIVSGRFDVACKTILDVEALADPFSPEECRFTPAAQRFNLPPEFRDSETLARVIDDLIREYPEVTVWRIARGVVALDCGDTEGARAALEQGTAGDFAIVPRNVSYLIALAALVRIAWGLGETRYAHRLRELLLPYAGAQVSTGVGIGYEGPVDWYLGVLAVQLGRRREAARRFAVALATTERLGAWPWRARTELTYADLLATGSSTERARARSLASSAATTALRLGMRQLHMQAEQVLVRLGARNSRAPHS